MAGTADAILSPPPVPITFGTGEIVAQLAAAVRDGDLIFAATDEQQAVAVTSALAIAVPDATILACPSSDALPGDDAPASPANVGRRVSTLRRIRLALAEAARPRIACVTTGEALGRLYPPPAAFDSAPPMVAVGERIDLPALFERLTQIGYIADERVDEPGEVALRGQVLDVYPADADVPLRIEAADGNVAGMRLYDPADQRTTAECTMRELGRVSEPPLDSGGVTLIDHLPDARIVLSPAADDRRKRFLALARDAERRRPKRAVRDIVDETAWSRAIADRKRIDLVHQGEPPPRFVETNRPLQAFARFANDRLRARWSVVLLGGERDLRFLAPRNGAALERTVVRVDAWAAVTAAEPGTLLALPLPIERGFRAGDVIAVAAADLIGGRAERAGAEMTAADTTPFGFSDIRIGDVVVHEDHGIATVAGVAPMPAVGDSEPGDAIALTYADHGLRLVPVNEAGRIWRYGAEADAVTLDKLDGTGWEKRRAMIDAAIAESARGLTAIAATRNGRSAPVLDPDPAAYERFAARFPFSETADQARAIGAVRDDLASGRPMDRLVIGDVGYGKTEVALRAAAIAALAGRQVAIAAPTTVLARQHLESFADRFEGTGIVVAGLSRLSSAAEKRRVKAGLADGSIGIVVGTGAVAGRNIAYQNLALVVIDEEQRFGAAEKARMRELGSGHVLTLSATPIPRTLQNALIGLQQLSVIATPPARRQPIRTAVGPFDPGSARTALLREKSRGGQSFVVVPRIEDIASLARQIAQLVPELELMQAHGKMPAQEIDETMVRFGRGEGDILLATNIIEAGLDVPRANTMMIWRADRFGLSQLHQLRGRVGRGGRRGQVLLLTDPAAQIAPRTLKRLRTLEAFDRLGAGFAISARDLDMRGAGDLLGEAQAGHMKLIGIDLYQHLLEASLRAARGEAIERWSPQLNLGIQGRLPEIWIPDEEIRVSLYCRLARIEDDQALTDFAAELEDRFGSLPQDAVVLLDVTRVRIAAHSARIARIDSGPAAIALTPRPDFAGHAETLIEKKGRFLLSEHIADPTERLARLETLLATIEPHYTPAPHGNPMDIDRGKDAYGERWSLPS